jgi:hypothetical protein
MIAKETFTRVWIPKNGYLKKRDLSDPSHWIPIKLQQLDILIYSAMAEETS